ncbi:MAG: hypothetical protein JXR73_14655 [Candidatus Omnitrophica bacterium]|nr:hypothetical protein [Candidatus Omnitrophota bacterium]
MKIHPFLFSAVILLSSILWILPSSCSENPVVYVAFWFDTEDYILPQADDAAKRLAEMFAERNVQATFKIVGEKARVLEERGRDDVILALAKNDIAYHATNHSIHPTPAEYSRDLDWHEGVREFIRREGIGLKTLQQVFGVNASCYGQAGGSWTPQSYAALHKFQIPLYLDATPHVNLDDRPFWFCGILTILELGDCVMRTGWTNDEVKQACAEFDRVHQKLTREGGGIISIYYHPCEFIHEEFWDGVNFSRGANPPRSEWKLPPMKSSQEQEQAFNAFETYLDHIVKHPGVQLVTAREIPSLYPDRAYTRPITQNDIRTIARTFQDQLSYIDLGDRILSAGEGLYALSQFVAKSKNGSHPAEVSLKFAYGPASQPLRIASEGSFRWEAIQQAAQDLVDAVDDAEQLPSAAWVDGRPWRLEDFAKTLAYAVADESYSGDITMQQGELRTMDYVADNAPDLWGWVIFPEGFDAPRMMEIAKRQAWTIKPARLRLSN